MQVYKIYIRENYYDSFRLFRILNHSTLKDAISLVYNLRWYFYDNECKKYAFQIRNSNGYVVRSFPALNKNY